MEPSLLILAAGIGSRYGSLKQIEAIGPSGETIMDYSIYDAKRAGLKKVVFVIKRDFEKEFNDVIVKKYKNKIEIDYVFQELYPLPAPYKPNPNRIKPWGTCHAVLVAADKIKEPFIVINADDFYGQHSFKILCDYLRTTNDEQQTTKSYAMSGFILKDTLSEHGTVTRAICNVDYENYLKTITERFKIKRVDSKIVCIENNEEVEVNENSIVSLNLWGFTPSIFPEFRKIFEAFIQKNYNNTAAEILLPDCVYELIKNNFAKVKVLKTESKWFGLTYKEDKPIVVDNINKLIASGEYPDNLGMC